MSKFSEVQKHEAHPEFLTLLDHKYQDRDYKEVDGIYIVYQGHVDVLSHKDNKLLTQVKLFENFGESKVLKRPAYEYLGDLYAGLNPLNPQKSGKNITDLMRSKLGKTIAKRGTSLNLTRSQALTKAQAGSHSQSPTTKKDSALTTSMNMSEFEKLLE